MASSGRLSSRRTLEADCFGQTGFPWRLTQEVSNLLPRARLAFQYAVAIAQRDKQPEVLPQYLKLADSVVATIGHPDAGAVEANAQGI